MKKKIFTTIILIFLFAGTVVFGAGNLDIPVKKYVLSNLLTVLIAERHDAPIFSAHILFKVGSVDDPTGLTGVAHMLEHMMFKGTKIIGTTDYEAEVPIMEKIDSLLGEIEKEKANGIVSSSDVDWEKIKKAEAEIKKLEKEQEKYVIPNEMDAIYARNGEEGFNAYTANDRTCYIISLPSNRLSLWAFLESDRIKNPVFRMFTSERDTVLEERKLRNEDSPSGRMWEEFFAALYQANPRHNPIVGWASDIENFTPGDVMEVFKRNYSPQNTVIVLCGDIYPDRAVKVMEKYFGDIENSAKVRTVFTEEKKQSGARRVEVKFDAKPQILIGFHGPKPLSKERFALDLLSDIAGSGKTSRLYKELVENKKLTSGIWAGVAPFKYDVPFMIGATPVEGVDLKAVEEEIFTQIEKLKTEKVSQWELQKVKNGVNAYFVRGLKGRSNLASELAYAEGVLGDWRLFDLRKNYEEVTADDIQKVAQKYLNRDKSTVIVLKETEKEAR
ncbi:MAG: pitrilysin family protein [Armatimonadota bacterium]